MTTVKKSEEHRKDIEEIYKSMNVHKNVLFHKRKGNQEKSNVCERQQM